MSAREVDFTFSNYSHAGRIVRPESKTQQHRIERPSKDHPGGPSSAGSASKPAKSSTFIIEKSFVPEPVSSIPEEHRKLMQPQIEGLAKFAKEKAKRDRELAKLIAQDKIKLEQEKKEESIASEGIHIDASGKMRDSKDNLVFVKNQSLQLLSNKNKEREQKEKEIQLRHRKRFFDRVQSRSLKDTNLILSSSKKRTKRTLAGLQFIEQGALQQAKALYSQQSSVRTDQQDDSLAGLIKRSPSEKLQDGAEKEYEQPRPQPKRRTRVKFQFIEMLPDKEWWDEQLLTCPNYQPLWEVNKASQIPSNLVNLLPITEEVQKGRLFKEEEEEQIVMPVFLTKDEKKKLKRRRKQERLKERNNQIKLGLIEPDKPKLKFSNMAIVLKDEFIMDPSRVESQVRKQVQERLDKHNEENASRKLTKQKKAEKMLRKQKRDSAKETRIAVFRIESVKDRTARFKIEMNVKQLALNGYFFVPTQDFNGPAVVIVEGGRRAIRFFKNLMLHRISWSEVYRSNLLTKEELEQQTVDTQQKVRLQGNRCLLVWEAVINETTFSRWKSEFINCESDAIRLLAEKKLQHLWDAVINYKEAE